MQYASGSNSCPTGHGNSWIMYQARMRYLRSRQGSGRENKRSLGESSSEETLPSITAAHEPCSGEKLLPPLELMTRSRALRYTYWKHHEPLLSENIGRLHFRKKCEDPAVKKKREEIFAKIRAAEAAAVERRRREREAIKRAERLRRQGSDPRLTRVPSETEHESSNVDDLEIIDTPISRARPSFGDDASYSSKEDEAGEFSFLSDWVKHKTIQWKRTPAGATGKSRAT